jgi:hypothetical protein
MDCSRYVCCIVVPQQHFFSFIFAIKGNDTPQINIIWYRFHYEFISKLFLSFGIGLQTNLRYLDIYRQYNKIRMNRVLHL